VAFQQKWQNPISLMAFFLLLRYNFVAVDLTLIVKYLSKKYPVAAVLQTAVYQNDLNCIANLNSPF
jgi:hypothetical protein